MSLGECIEGLPELPQLNGIREGALFTHRLSVAMPRMCVLCRNDAGTTADSTWRLIGRFAPLARDVSAGESVPAFGVELMAASQPPQRLTVDERLQTDRTRSESLA